MGDHRTITLQYGHLGSATYLPDAQVWEFSRKIDREPSLGFYGHVKCAFPAPKTPGACTTTRNTDRLLTNKDEDALLKARPELAPGLSLLRRQEAVSRAITTAVAKFDPQVSNLLAIGNAITLDQRGGEGDSTVPIAVLVCGDSAASIKLVELDDEEIAWPTNSDGLVKVPTLQSREKALWMGTAGPVQQICFAETVDEKSTWLAVRFLQSTIVFRPQRNKLPLSVHYDDMDFMRKNLEDTRLDANPVLEIPISCTGGIPHADITFNPWYQQQIAVVDRLGNWTVWDIGKQRQSTYWHADPGPSGSLDSEETRHHGERTQRDHYDGWAAISWVGNVHKLLVCDRRNIVLYRIDADPVQHYTVDVNLHQESEWILDIKRSQSNLSSVFVLTTTQILWLHVNPDDFPSSSQRGDGQEVTVLLSWRHFRDPDDTSLQLVPMLVQNFLAFSLIICSQLNNMAQVFRFAFSPDDPSIPISVADPSFLPLPTSNSRDLNALEPSLGDVYFSSLIFQQIVNSSVIDPTNDSKTLILVKFIGQRSNLEVIEALYVARADGGDETYEPFSSTPPRVKTQKSSKLVDDDDFIVDDLNEVVLPLYSEISNWNGESRNTQEQPIRASPYGENWVDLYELASAAVTEQIGNRGRLTMSEKRFQTFNHWLEDLTTKFEEFALGDSALSSNSRTMLDILPSPPFLDDIDRNTHDFDQFLTRLEDPMQNMLPLGYEITHLPMSYFPPSNISISDTASRSMIPTNITKLYDSLVRDWLFPLPGDFPNKIRMAKEKNIRNIVMQLILSRIVLTRRSIPEPHDPGLRLISETAEDDLSSLHPSSSAPWSSQVLLFTQSQNPTITTTSDGQTELEQSSFFQPSSQTTAAAAATATTAATVTTRTPYATLRLYTPLKQPDQPGLPRRIADILSHWKLGANPSTYDWQATVRTLRDEEEQQTESQSASRRRKRREARRLQRRQQQQSQQSYLPSSSATAPAPASGPTIASTSSVPTPSASQVPVVRMWGSQQHQQHQLSRGIGQGSFLGPGTDRGIGIAMGSQMMVRSSQVAEEGDVPMTQIERGVFGSRNASSRKVAKERKKKRAAGF
ncbi:RNA polymerase I-specific transcription initiation factor RRN6 [Blastomyces parvus]|uniref:RNA polymerase I-specific transcription initiation factor RRN6 n=1 Tax=Blastomyces parvus TaxID=2060905 RepID=A0A2B7X516_9EURO|nr:RNA polymerase I-specific transcription initiation factor RRN6 [Blastomyces parvus]